ncbi:MAG: GGDEF domain-containing protein [Firmicutes bacterium]|nr:GGDEF domain-containing protein [Bacillota bacterium]
MEILLYAEIYFICMTIMALVLYWTGRNEDSSLTGIWFKAVLIFFLANFVSNFLFTLCRPQIAESTAVKNLAFILKTIYHVSLIGGVYTWCNYTAAELGSSRLSSKKARTALGCILLLPILSALLNIRFRHLFDISKQGTYLRGPGFHFQMLILIGVTFIYSIFVLKGLRNESDPLKASHHRLLASFPLCLLAAWVLSFIGESVPVICVSISIEILCVYIGFFTQRISTDKLTQVNNRQNLISYIDYKIAHHDDPVYLMLIDLDYLKIINDTYGHLEGDKALTRVATALKMCCGPVEKRPYIARYGGDEFIVVVETTDGLLVDKLCNDIRNTLDDLNTKSGSGYRASLSIGIARLEEGMDHNDLIAKADEELYKIKKGR